MVGQQQWQTIHERHAGGHSISAIARDLDLDRKTVRSCLRQADWVPYRREVVAPTLLDDHRAWLAERAPQVHFSARILHQELRARGWQGSYETVKLAVRPLRAAACVASLTQCRFETGPGEQAQVDWGQVSVTMGGARVKIHVFVMTLCYSRRAYGEGFLHERIPDLLAAHENAFAHFGGRCEFLLYDNMRTVVDGTVLDTEGRRRPKFNSTFEAFARHWSFTPRLCQPYRAQAKAKAEVGVQIAQRWALFALRDRVFTDIAELNQELRVLNEKLNDHPFKKLKGTRRSRFEEGERTALKALPGVDFELCEWKYQVRVGSDHHVEHERCFYSVPFQFTGQRVDLRFTATMVEIFLSNRRVALHARLQEAGLSSTLPEHRPIAHERVLEGEPKELLQWAGSVGEKAKEMINFHLTDRRDRGNGLRAAKRMRELARDFGEARFESACGYALKSNITSLRAVESILKNEADLRPARSTAPYNRPMHANVRGARYFGDQS